MAKRRQTVDQWVQQVIAEVIDNKACSAVALLHLKGVGGATEEVATRPIEGNVNIREFADNLVTRAEGFSQELPGLQTFKLLAFYGSNEPHNPFHFTCNDGNVVSRMEAAMSAHEPTPTGLLGQLMKHNENLMHQNNSLVTANMTLANGMMAMCFGPEGAIQQSIRAQLDAISVVRDASLDMYERREKLQRDQLSGAQELQMRKAVIDGIPHFLNRWTGREIFDDNKNKVAIFDELAMTITPDDLQMLVAMGKISKEKALLLSAQFAKVVEDKKKELQALKGVPSESEAPLAVVNGQVNGNGAKGHEQ